MDDFITRSLSPVDRLAPVYCGTLVVTSVIVTSWSLHHSATYTDIMLQSFTLYTYIVAILFLLYLLVGVHHYLGKGLHTQEEGDEGTSGSGRRRARRSASLVLTMGAVSSHTDHQEAYDDVVLPVLYNGEFMNGMLRAALVVLSVGSLASESVHLRMLYLKPECHSWFAVTLYALTIVLTVVQTGTLLKHARIFINFRYRTIRLGLSHVIAANLIKWLTDVIQRTSDDLQPLADDLVKQGLNTSITQVVCLQEQQSTPLAHADYYLFAVRVQFFLLCAGLFYKIYTRTGSTVLKFFSPDIEGSIMASERRAKLAGRTPKDQPSLILTIVLGVSLVLGILAGVVMFVYYLEIQDWDYVNKIKIIYLVSELGCVSLGVFFSIAVLVALRKHRFWEVRDAAFENNLLTLAFFGVYSLMFFLLLGQGVSVTEPLAGTMDKFFLATNLLGLFQTAFQTAVIKDALWRTPMTLKQAWRKPGQAAVAFLIAINLSLWMVNVIELRGLFWMSSAANKALYSPLVWVLGTNLLLPLAATYRLLAALSLGAVWCRAYEPLMAMKIESASREGTLQGADHVTRKMDLGYRGRHNSPDALTRY